MSAKFVRSVLILCFGLCSVMFAWQADRVRIGDSWTNYWVITCNDGYVHGGNYGPDGPSFLDGRKVCENHGGIVVKPNSGGPVAYQVLVGPPERLNLLLSDLVDAGIVDPRDATRLTSEKEPAAWAKTRIGITPVSGGGPGDAVTFAAIRLDLPDGERLPWWQTAVAAAFLLLIVVLMRRKARPRQESH